MRIQHNIPAMNAYRNYNSNTKALQSNLQKLSSGYKINKAGDDAAGLAISEKMRAQITGLEVAQKNAKDGISLVQTAEGAMTEIHTMLNRMFSLAEQSANGTYNDDVDREQLDAEFQKLTEEIDRIADATNFNGKKLLNGKLGKEDTGDSTQAEPIKEYKATVDGTTNTGGVNKATLDFSVAATSITDDDKKALNNALKTSGITATFDASSSTTTTTVTVDDGDTLAITGPTGYTLTMKNSSGNADVNMSTGKSLTSANTAGQNVTYGTSYEVLIRKGTNVTDPVIAKLTIQGTPAPGATKFNFAEPAKQTENATLDTSGTPAPTVKLADDFGIASIDMKGTKVDEGADVSVTFTAAEHLEITIGTTKFTADLSAATGKAPADIKGQELELDDGNGNKIKVTMDADDTKIKIGKGQTAVPGGVVGKTKAGAEKSTDGLRLRVGDSVEDYDNIYVDIKSMKAAELTGVKDTTTTLDSLDVKTAATADTAMTALKDMINYVSNERGKLGATQNRLDHTINNLSTMQENIQDAEATIRDVDVAEEMMKYTKNNILVQSAQAMLAQANQLPQGVLQLLG